MFTQCPQCKTTFRVLATQLKAAKGQVRCGECGNAFDALENLMDPGRAAAAAASATEQARAYRHTAPSGPQPRVHAATAVTDAAAQRPSPTQPPFHEPKASSPITAKGRRQDDEDFGAADKLTESLTLDPFGADHIKALFPDVAGDEDILPGDRTDADARSSKEPADVTGGLGSWSATRSQDLGSLASAQEENLETHRKAARAAEHRPAPSDASDTAKDGEEPEHRSFPEPLEEASTAAASRDPDFARDERQDYVLPPELEYEPKRKRLLPTAIWMVGTLLMAALLLGQFAHHEAAMLASRYDEARPWLEELCKHTGCQLPPRRSLAAIEMTTNTVQSHPRYKDALLVTATLINRAPFDQPYPDVEILMTDLQERAVARRRFTPEQYLAEAHKETFESQGTAHLMLEVTDPGPSAVSFEFNFY